MMDRITEKAKKYLLEICLIGVGILIFSGSLALFLSAKQSSTAEPPSPIIETSSQSAPQEEIWIDIEGAVRNPGVYSFPSQTRIKEAIKRAGDLNEKADELYFVRTVNQAQILTDQMKLYIPTKEEVRIGFIQGSSVPSPTPVSTSPDSLKVSINEAFQDELMALPGIGEVTAQKIIKMRPYISIEDLINKKVISKSVFEKIKELVVL